MPLNYKKVIAALFIAFAMIYIRGIYRTVELAQGWTGFLITHEGFFLGLDASVMVVAVWIFLVFDPAVLLPDAPLTAAATVVPASGAGPEVKTGGL
jgi:hypothetical protein